MNHKRFELLMGSVDDDLLEQAQQPRKKKRAWGWAAGAAACAGLLLCGYWLTRPGPDAGQAAQPDGITAAQVEQMGYSLPVPEGAREAVYSILEWGRDGADVVQVEFEQNGQAYSCRALKSGQPEDISGLSADWTQSLDWSVGTLEMQMRQSKDEAWVGWYAGDVGIQWCLSGQEDALSLLHTAQSIVETLGYDMAVAPEGAENVVYNAFELEGLAVGETTFSLNGVSCSFRTAATGAVEEEFADISGVDLDFQNQAAGEVLWCPARLYFDEGGAGKIVWFDVVPGLLYSLSVDRDASGQGLLDMAEQLFTPAQGEVDGAAPG